MKVVIFEGKEDDSIIRLRLIEEDDEIKLVAVSSDGNIKQSGYILSICEDGTLRLYEDCKVKGIQVDNDGCIRIQ